MVRVMDAPVPLMAVTLPHTYGQAASLANPSDDDVVASVRVIVPASIQSTLLFETCTFTVAAPAPAVVVPFA